MLSPAEGLHLRGSYRLIVLKDNKQIAESPSFVAKPPPFGGRIHVEQQEDLFTLHTEWDESNLRQEFVESKGRR